MDNLELFALKDFSWLDIKADKLTQYKQGDQFTHPDYATAAQMGFIGTADDLEMAKQAKNDDYVVLNQKLIATL